MWLCGAWKLWWGSCAEFSTAYCIQDVADFSSNQGASSIFAEVHPVDPAGNARQGPSLASQNFSH